MNENGADTRAAVMERLLPRWHRGEVLTTGEFNELVTALVCENTAVHHTAAALTSVLANRGALIADVIQARLQGADGHLMMAVDQLVYNVAPLGAHLPAGEAVH